MLTAAEVRSARVVSNVFEPLFEVTKEFSEEKLPTAGKVIPVLMLMQEVSTKHTTYKHGN